MKITKPGVLPATLVMKGKCTNCGCEFEFTRGEATYHEHRGEGSYVLTCPTLGCCQSVSVRL